jgi:hypothetical protein
MRKDKDVEFNSFSLLSNQINSVKLLVNQSHKELKDGLDKILNENLELKNKTNISFSEVKIELKSLHTEISHLKTQIKSLNSSNVEIKKEILELKNLVLYPFVGISNNIPISTLTNKGYSYVYNKPYTHITTSSEMDEIKSLCLPTTVLCLGGRDITNDVLLVISCALCDDILSQTARNTPNLYNGAYWYYTPNVGGARSIGFAPNTTILQFNVDIFDQSNNQRVSWYLTGTYGGWRLGSLTGLDQSSHYNKVILKK